MKMPWVRDHDTEPEAAEHQVQAVRAHLRILLNELEATLARIEDKRRRGMPE